MERLFTDNKLQEIADSVLDEELDEEIRKVNFEINHLNGGNDPDLILYKEILSKRIRPSTESEILI